jgi:hypothetical protein
MINYVGNFYLMFKIITLQENPHYLDTMINLIEKLYGYDEKNSFAIDFYALINKENWRNCYLIISTNKKDKDVLIGHIGTKPRNLKIKNNLHKSIFIGGIAIAPKYQGKGIFKKAFSELLLKLKKKYQYAMLWSDKIDLYKKFGFEEISKCKLNYSKLPTVKTLNTYGYQLSTFTNLPNHNKDEIRELYKINIENIYITPERTLLTWEDIKNTSSIQLYTKFNRNNIIGYCLVGKGQDYEGIIHEFAVSTRYPEELKSIKKLTSIWYDSNEKKTIDTILIPTALVLSMDNTQHLKKALNYQDLFISGADSI